MGKNGLNEALEASINQKQGSKAHPVVTDAEAKQRKAAGKTQGAKGAKMDRINMAFNSENFEYLRTMAGIRGQSITAFCNDIIAEHREKNAAVFEQARALVDSMK